MNISPATQICLNRLINSVNALLFRLEADLNTNPRNVTSQIEGASVIRNYLSILNKGQSQDDAQLALKGTNLLTSVNKGLADAETPTTEKSISRLSFAVLQESIDTAKHLRADLGMGF